MAGDVGQRGRWRGLVAVHRRRLGSGMTECAYGLRDPTGSFAVELRTREVGQQDRRNTGGEVLLGTELTCGGGSGEIPVWGGSWLHGEALAMVCRG